MGWENGKVNMELVTHGLEDHFEVPKFQGIEAYYVWFIYYVL